MTYQSDALLVDKMLGDSYQVVRLVARNIEFVKHISAHLPEVYRVYSSIEDIAAILESVAQIDAVSENLADILTVATAAADIGSLADNLAVLQGLHTNIGLIVTVFNNLPKIETVEANMTKVAALHTNMDALLNINTNLPALLALDNLEDLLAGADLVSALNPRVTALEIALPALETALDARLDAVEAVQGATLSPTRLATSVITTDKIANLSITTDKIANTSITPAKFATNAVRDAIPDGTFPGTKLETLSLRDTLFPNPGVHLFAIRRKLLRNVADLYDFGCVPSGSDCSAAINGAINTLRTENGIFNLYVPPGSWNCDAELVHNYGLNLFGDHMSTSVLTVRHAGYGVRCNGLYGMGGSIRNLSILSYGVNPSVGLYLKADAGGNAPHYMVLEGLNISGTGLWGYSAIIDGDLSGPAVYSAVFGSTPGSNIMSVSGASWATNQWATGYLVCRVTSGAGADQVRYITANTANTFTVDSIFSPNVAAGDSFVIEAATYGLRNIRMRDCTLFQSSWRNLELRHVRGMFMSDVASYGVNNILHLRGANASFPSSGVSINGYIGGNVIVDTSDNVNFSGSVQGTLTLASTLASGHFTVGNNTTVSNASAAIIN